MKGSTKSELKTSRSSRGRLTLTAKVILQEGRAKIDCKSHGDQGEINSKHYTAGVLNPFHPDSSKLHIRAKPGLSSQDHCAIVVPYPCFSCQSRDPKLGGGFRALQLVLVLLSRFPRPTQP